jgi:cell division protein FtsZ
MNNPDPTQPPEKPALSIKLFGVGTAGIRILEQLFRSGLLGVEFIAVNSDAQSLGTSSVPTKLQLETTLLRGLGTGGDPERGRSLAEEHQEKIKALCKGASAVFIIAGLGGGSGTGISPVVARVAREAGALALAFVATPFQCEGNRRQHLAQHGLEELKEAADGVVCLPNQKLFKLIDENTSILDAFKLTDELLADAVRGLWRLLARPGLLEIHFAEVCALLRERHVESAFAVAEAIGPTRSRDVMDKLLAHPMLDGGRLLGESDAVLVSLTGGPDLTMADVNRVMEQVNGQCKGAQVIMGAAIDENFRERLVVTLIAARKTPEPPESAPGSEGEKLDAQLLERSTTVRPGSRFVPPAPALPPDQLEKLAARQRVANPRARRTTGTKMRQGQLPLEIVSKGRFDKSEPTIHKGEDLDVPTYIRRGVPLN